MDVDDPGSYRPSMPTRYQDTELGSHPDLLKDDSKDKFGRFKAGAASRLRRQL